MEKEQLQKLLPYLEKDFTDKRTALLVIMKELRLGTRSPDDPAYTDAQYELLLSEVLYKSLHNHLYKHYTPTSFTLYTANFVHQFPSSAKLQKKVKRDIYYQNLERVMTFFCPEQKKAFYQDNFYNYIIQPAFANNFNLSLPLNIVEQVTSFNITSKDLVNPQINRYFTQKMDLDFPNDLNLFEIFSLPGKTQVNKQHAIGCSNTKPQNTLVFNRSEIFKNDGYAQFNFQITNKKNTSYNFEMFFARQESTLKLIALSLDYFTKSNNQTGFFNLKGLFNKIGYSRLSQKKIDFIIHDIPDDIDFFVTSRGHAKATYIPSTNKYLLSDEKGYQNYIGNIKVNEYSKLIYRCHNLAAKKQTQKTPIAYLSLIDKESLNTYLGTIPIYR